MKIEPDTVQIRENLTYEAHNVLVADQRTKQLRGKDIGLVKIVWSDTTENVTWEFENTMRK